MVAKTLTPGSVLLLLVVACGDRAPQAERPAAPAAEAPPAGPHGAAHDSHAAGHDQSCGVIGHRFEDADKWAERFDDPARDAWQKPQEVVRVMAIEPGSTVADVGAGTGYFLPHLSAAVGPEGRVLGLDIEPDMVRYMEQRVEREGLANVQARQVEPDDPGLAAGSVDRVLVVDTWHHIGDRAAYAAHIGRALEPGGALYIVDFTLETDKGPPPAHRVAPDAVVAELEAAGLEADIVDEPLPDQYIVRARAQGN